MRNPFVSLMISLILVMEFAFSPLKVTAQSETGWSVYENISKTPTSSIYPSVAADRFGRVHVVWVEDVEGKTKNLIFTRDGLPLLDSQGRQVNFLNFPGNTVYYTYWEKGKWSKPIDIQTVPINTNLYFPDITVDSKGYLHMIWLVSAGLATDLYYSQVPVDEAESVKAWSEPVVLASNVRSTYYPAGIIADHNDNLHIIYFQVGVNPGLFVINSSDQGMNWSDPVQIYASNSDTGGEDGCMPVRIILDNKNRLHAAWTVYGSDGNGKSVYYSQSDDQGETWSSPLLVSSVQPGWYEVDWINVGVSGDEIHLVWQGGWAPPVQYERISYDGGKTWSRESRILTGIVGENGFSDLLVDSAGIIHQLLVKRFQGSSAYVFGVWYSEFLNGQWKIPILIGVSDKNIYTELQSNTLSTNDVKSIVDGTINADGLRYQRSVILNGNELFVVVVNEFDGEIYSSHMTLKAPRIEPNPFPTQEPIILTQPTQASLIKLESTPTVSFDKIMGQSSQNPGTVVMISIVPVFLLLLGLIVYLKFAYRK